MINRSYGGGAVHQLSSGVAVLTGLAALAGLASGAELSILSVTPGEERVERYAPFELALEVAGDWENPFDPEQIDITAHFTTPSGKVLDVPAFYYRAYSSRVLPASAKRARVRFLKLFINELEWGPNSPVDFFIDDVKLLDSATDRTVSLGDVEAGPGPWRLSDHLVLTDEMARTGSRSLRFSPSIDLEENWPGAVLDCRGADWSGSDGLSLWLYPRTARIAAPVHLYFEAEDGTRSPIMRWSPQSLRANEWNHLVWDWREFRPDIRFEAQGEPGWRVRFTPVEEGRHTYYVSARNRRSSAKSEERTFDVTPSDRPGFVRVSLDDPHYFVHDNGDLFFPIGHDVIWSGAGGPLSEARAYFPKMQAHGENCTYLIMGALDAFPPRLAIEWEKLGAYDLEAAACLDWYLDLAEKHGIYFKLSFDVHAHNIVGKPLGLWDANPYSAGRGGPCTGPNDFFTNREAVELYKKRLRYIVARWGYHPNIMAWESFAEINGAVEVDGRAGWRYAAGEEHPDVSRMLANWLSETSDYLRSIDPHDHLISVSFGGDGSDDRLWSLPQMDYTQIHHYNSVDTAPAIARWCRSLTERYAKPMMVTEFGWGVRSTDLSIDPTGICNHNGIWASVMSGAAGSAMNWWCRRIDKLDLYPQFQALRNFARTVEWDKEGFRPADVELRAPAQDELPSVTLDARGPFFGATVSDFTVASDGTVNDPGQVPSHLLAPGRPEPRVLPVFHVDYPADGTFAVYVDTVSPDARLDVYLDGEPALSRELPAENVEGKPSTFSERWQVWQCAYDEDFAIEVPAGRHSIRIENGKPGFSWIRISHYTLTNYDPQPLRAFGLTGRNATLLWIQNKQSTWGNDRLGKQPPAVEGAEAEVSGLTAGDYMIEWWDTYDGKVSYSETATAEAGRLRLTVPPLERDVACKIIRIP